MESSNKCAVGECVKPAYRRGWCDGHYREVLRNQPEKVRLGRARIYQCSRCPRQATMYLNPAGTTKDEAQPLCKRCAIYRVISKEHLHYVKILLKEKE